MINTLAKSYLIFAIVNLNANKYVTADVFTSVNHMKQILDIEYLLMFHLNQYIIGQEKQLNHIHK